MNTTTSSSPRHWPRISPDSWVFVSNNGDASGLRPFWSVRLLGATFEIGALIQQDGTNRFTVSCDSEDMLIEDYEQHLSGKIFDTLDAAKDACEKLLAVIYH